MRQGFDLLRVIGECAAVFPLRRRHLPDDVLVQQGQPVAQPVQALAGAGQGLALLRGEFFAGGARRAQGGQGAMQRVQTGRSRGGGQALAAQALLRLGAGLAFLPGGLGGLQPQQRLGLGLAVLLGGLPGGLRLDGAGLRIEQRGHPGLQLLQLGLGAGLVDVAPVQALQGLPALGLLGL